MITYCIIILEYLCDIKNRNNNYLNYETMYI